MAKKSKTIRPFFALRWEMADTMEALTNELLMLIQAIETAIQLGDMNDAAKKLLSERVEALKKICIAEEGQ